MKPNNKRLKSESDVFFQIGTKSGPAKKIPVWKYVENIIWKYVDDEIESFCFLPQWGFKFTRCLLIINSLVSPRWGMTISFCTIWWGYSCWSSSWWFSSHLRWCFYWAEHFIWWIEDRYKPSIHYTPRTPLFEFWFNELGSQKWQFLVNYKVSRGGNDRNAIVYDISFSWIQWKSWISTLSTSFITFSEREPFAIT